MSLSEFSDAPALVAVTSLSMSHPTVCAKIKGDESHRSGVAADIEGSLENPPTNEKQHCFESVRSEV